MKKIFALAVFLISSTSFGQLHKTIEFDVIGNPTWDITTPTKDNGLIFMVKTDVTKVLIKKYSSNLEEQWQNEFYIDAEKPPTAYVVTENKVSFLFSESHGMYYQLIEFQLADGKVAYHGFELRDLFDDQDYILTSNSVLLAGKVKTGGAFYKANLTTGEGILKANEITGNDVNVQHFEAIPKEDKIISLWSVKQLGYSNEKKKKGPFVKSSQLVYAEFDENGNFLTKTAILPQKGYFPMNGKLITTAKGEKFIVGNFQSSTKDKGIFWVSLSNPTQIQFYSYQKVLQSESAISEKDYKTLLEQFTFLPIQPAFTNETIGYGGVFFRAEYNTVSTYNNQNYNPYYPSYMGSNYGYYNNYNRSQSRQVFNGYQYPIGFVVTFDSEGNLIQNHRLDLNQKSNQIQSTISINDNNSIAYCMDGKIAIKNLNISSKPYLFNLSDDKSATKNPNYIPNYQSVNHWYKSYFIAIGSKIKMEATSVEPVNKPTKTRFRRKQNQVPSELRIRKTYYFSKIMSGNSY